MLRRSEQDSQALRQQLAELTIQRNKAHQVSMLCSVLGVLSMQQGAPDDAGRLHMGTPGLPDARMKRQRCFSHLQAVVCCEPQSSPSAAAAVDDPPVMSVSSNCCSQDARVLQQQLATETSLRQNAMDDYRAMQSQLVALSGDLDVSQQKQRALQQQLAAEQVGLWPRFETVT